MRRAVFGLPAPVPPVTSAASVPTEVSPVSGG